MLHPDKINLSKPEWTLQVRQFSEETFKLFNCLLLRVKSALPPFISEDSEINAEREKMTLLPQVIVREFVPDNITKGISEALDLRESIWINSNDFREKVAQIEKEKLENIRRQNKLQEYEANLAAAKREKKETEKKQKREAESLEDKCKVKQDLVEKLQVQVEKLTAAIDIRDNKIQEHILSAENEKKETENKLEREAESLKKVMQDQMKKKDELIAKLQAQAAFDQKNMTDALNQAKEPKNHIENMLINCQIHEEELMEKTANLDVMKDKLEMKDKDMSKLQNEFDRYIKENEGPKRKIVEEQELSLGSPYKKIKIQPKSGLFYFNVNDESKRLIIDAEPQTGK